MNIIYWLPEGVKISIRLNILVRRFNVIFYFQCLCICFFYNKSLRRMFNFVLPLSPTISRVISSVLSHYAIIKSSNWNDALHRHHTAYKLMRHTKPNSRHLYYFRLNSKLIKSADWGEVFIDCCIML